MRMSLLFAACTCLLLLLSACEMSTGADSCLNSSHCQSSLSQQSGTDYRTMARQDAIDAGINADYFEAQINQESGFNPNVVSYAGAIGIAQIMKSTADSWHVNPWDPIASLKAASQHMAWYQNTYGDYNHALACYNAGCSTLLRAEQNCLNYYWCLPQQTQHYITIITGYEP